MDLSVLSNIENNFNLENKELNYQETTNTDQLKSYKDFRDDTLACDDKQIRTHRSILNIHDVGDDIVNSHDVLKKSYDLENIGDCEKEDTLDNIEVNDEDITDKNSITSFIDTAEDFNKQEMIC